MNVLVTGATGFLGRHLVDALLRRGHTVCALVRPAHRDRHGFDPRVRIHVADLVKVEEADLGPAFDAIDAVVHLAAAFVGSIEEQRRATVESTRRLLEAMARSRARRLVLAGSLSVYDWGQAREVLDEQTPLETRPHERDAYTIAKLEQEELVRQFSATHGFALTVLRPGFIWAARPGSAAIALGQDVGPLRVVIGPERRLPLVHVENCAEAFALAVEDERAVGETFNVVDPEAVTARWFARAIGALEGRRRLSIAVPYGLSHNLVKLAHLPARLVLGRHVPSFLVPRRFEARFKPIRFADDKLSRTLGWKPRITFKQAIATP